MREILFRGKRIDTGEWVYGDLIHYRNNDYRILEQGNGDWDILEAGYKVDPATVGQYTGLKDKNGKRIFEGDILKVYDYKCVAKFGFHEAGNGWYAETDDGVICELNDSFKIAEIISTIHDKGVPT